MAFWSDTTLDPKRAFKFKVTFGRLGGNATYLAQTADRPQFTISDGTKVDFLDKSFHFPGKITWEPVKVKFVDGAGVDVNTSRDSYVYLKNAGWISPSVFNPNGVGGGNFGTISKDAAATQSKLGGEIQITVLNSLGNAIDTWTIKNAFITKVTLNGLNYASEDILTAEYTFRYDWAELAGV